MAREGRGKLSSIDLLPEEAEEDVIWALEQLRERKMPQVLILVALNDRLVAKGITPISKSSFSRYAVRKAVQFRRHDEARRMSAELVKQLGPEGADEITVMVAELIKVAMLELLEGGDLSSKGVMEVARGLSSVVAAQRGSEEYRRKLGQRVNAELHRAADSLERVGRENGLSAERVAQLRREFLGVRS